MARDVPQRRKSAARPPLQAAVAIEEAAAQCNDGRPLRHESKRLADDVVLDQGIGIEKQHEPAAAFLVGLIIRPPKTGIHEIGNADDPRKLIPDELNRMIARIIVHDDNFEQRRRDRRLTID